MFLVFETSVTASFVLLSEEVLNPQLAVLYRRLGRDRDTGLDTLTIRIYTGYLADSMLMKGNGRSRATRCQCTAAARPRPVPSCGAGSVHASGASKDV